LSAGAFRPGEWLRQIDIESRYDMPRFTVRQVLAELALGEYLEHVPNRGYRVAEPSSAKRAEVTDVRLYLEIPAGHSAIDHATDADIERVAAAADAFEAAIEHGSYPSMRQLNHEFHRVLLGICPNTTLVALVNEMRERNLPGAWAGWSSPARTRASSRDHQRMVQALRTRDKAEMTKAITEHLTAWKRAE
jgi:DNA-binding GntR family transcriptional regulator